jgi:ATP-binding cassette ChvD family protein
MEYVYVMKGLSKTYKEKQVIKDTWLSFLPGAKIGIIGHNGAGKSTLLRIMAGVETDFQGEAWPAKGVKVGYLPQEPKLDHDKNVFDNIMEGLKDKKELLDEFNRISAKFAEDISDDEMNELFAKQAELQEKIDAVDGWNLEREIEMAMHALDCPDKESSIDHLSGGEKRRVALCKLLLEKPDMLLLDEPTNHLDAETVAWLEHYLKDYSGTVVAITHDRYFLDNITDWILEIDRGECVPWKGSYAEWLEQKQEKLENEEKAESQRQKQLKRERDWIKQGAKAQQAKNKARITAYEELASKSRDKPVGTGQICIPNGPRLGDKTIEAEHVSKSYGDKTLIKDLSFNMPKGAVVGIIGPNGAGKTTLFRMITGNAEPDSGTIELGSSVELGYVDQSRDELDPSKTVWEEISDGHEEVDLGGKSVKSRAYCSSFNFKGGDQQKPVSDLSGGERNRVHLAKMLKKGANVILLDEPSNDLDVDTLRALEDAIEDFAGCVMVVSHDRWFLDRIATHIISFDKNGNAMWFEGNFQSYHDYMVANYGENYHTEKVKHKKLA